MIRTEIGSNIFRIRKMLDQNSGVLVQKMARVKHSTGLQLAIAATHCSSVTNMSVTQLSVNSYLLYFTVVCIAVSQRMINQIDIGSAQARLASTWAE